jgi:septal ring factor EnvC (AmiA/AmiB activator)
MAARQTTLKEIGEMVAHAVRHMATKEDIQRIDKRSSRVEDRLGKMDAKIDRLDPKLNKFEENEVDRRLCQSQSLAGQEQAGPFHTNRTCRLLRAEQVRSL